MGKDLLGYTFTFFTFSGISQKFFHKYKGLSLIVLDNEHLMVKVTWKYFRENFDGTETTNI